MTGPREQAVRDALADRPAGILRREKSKSLWSTFTALFCGARSRGYVLRSCNLSIGKAEAEWGWPHDWERLKQLGLIDYTITEKAMPGAVGGRGQIVEWSATEKGSEVREDDVSWFCELMAARQQDETAALIEDLQCRAGTYPTPSELVITDDQVGSLADYCESLISAHGSSADRAKLESAIRKGETKFMGLRLIVSKRNAR